MAQITSPAEDEYYAGLVTRNRGVVSDAQQQALRTATVLVAGCGSVGGAAVQPLARIGVQQFLVADSGLYELNNLNRQHATVNDIDRNKAEVAAERILAVNPYAQVKTYAEGVTEDNAAELTGACQVVVDGVDVTTMAGLRAKFALHQAAAGRRLPLITGWDMAGCLYAQYFDYHKVTKPFDGAITADDLDRLSVWDLIFRLLPLRRIPTDMLAELNANISRPDYAVPQVVYAAALFGAITSHMVAKVLAGERIKDEIRLDVHHAARPTAARLATALRWPREAVRLRLALAKHPPLAITRR
jgi:molybdopterin/thiamine biosynthesis adenylyltransferase